jgi:hypothetical protein
MNKETIASVLKSLDKDLEFVRYEYSQILQISKLSNKQQDYKELLENIKKLGEDIKQKIKEVINGNY